MTTAPINDSAVEIRKFNQYLGTFVASLGGFAFGISLGWNSTASLMMKNHFDASVIEIGLVGVMLIAGICLGAILALFLVSCRIDRSRIMFALSLLLFLTWIIFMARTDHTILMLIVGRSICGVCGGVFCVLTPIYVAEVASKEARGRLLMLFQVLINCGIMYAFVVSYILKNHTSLLKYNTLCGIACISVAATMLLPESPLYYLSKNDEINAAKSLRWYRGDTYDVQHEIGEMKRLPLAPPSIKCNVKLLKNRRVLRSIIACVGVMLGQNLCGIHMMTFFALMLFDNSGTGELTGNQQTLVVGAVQILASLLATFLVDVFGRRILLTVSSLLMGVFLMLLGLYCSIREGAPEYDDVYHWMSPSCVTMIFASYNLGLGPISWALLGDTLPHEVKTHVTSAAIAFGWFISLISGMAFEKVVITLGVIKIMLLTGAMCWLLALFCAIIVKDNSGKSLIEIQENFHGENATELGSTR